MIGWQPVTNFSARLDENDLAGGVRNRLPDIKGRSADGSASGCGSARRGYGVSGRSPRGLVELQRVAGNQAVIGLLAVQRRADDADLSPRPDSGSSTRPSADELSQQAAAPSSVQRKVPGPYVGHRVQGTSEQGVDPILAPHVQRSGGDSDQCGGGTCAQPGECASPDTGHEGAGQPSTRWELELNIDTAASSWETAIRTQSFGHAFVRFWESSGRQYTYGFYPAGPPPNENRRSVPGCVHHPDTTHDACVDQKVGYTLTSEQYRQGLASAQSVCSTGATYGQEYTCVTFAADVARAAGQSPPATKSQPAKVFFINVPPIDNPNSMAESVVAAQALKTDDQVRAWINGQDATSLNAVPTAEAIRLVALLLGGTWISEDDVAAVERFCGAMATSEQLAQIRVGVTNSVEAMWKPTQQTRVRSALNRAP